MKNIYLSLILLIVLFLIILFVIGILIIIKNIGKTQIDDVDDKGLQSCNNISTDTLTNINNNLNCKLNDISYKYLTYNDINFLLGPEPLFYYDVCINLCPSGFSGNIPNIICSNNNENDDFQNCVKTIKPINCKGKALPLGALGKELYYANYIANNIQC